MKVKINRLFHGFASVRDYQVEEAEKKQEPLLIECNGETMMIPLGELRKGFTNTDIFISKHDGKTYSLIDYDWKPQKHQLKLV